MQRLRAVDGCPWDREQTLGTLRHYLLEETYEVLEVMEGSQSEAHCEELGDLLLQIVFQSQIRKEEGSFSLADVVDAISDKMERRHPHVFGSESATDADAVAVRWDELKKQEGKGGLLDVSTSLPALMQAEKLGKKAAKVGFDWQDISGPLAKLDEELLELKQAIASGDKAEIESELGDLLFAGVNVGRHVGIRPELALLGTVDRFKTRFAYITSRLAETGRTPEMASLEELDTLWEEAKAGAISS
jgi:MazG family protein